LIQAVTLLENELSRLNLDNRILIGVDGLSRSGKTTIVKKLSQSLEEKGISTYVFHLDELIVERKRRYKTGFEPWYEYYQLQWDIDWLANNFYSKLRVAKELMVPFYDSELDKQKLEKVFLPEFCYIIIEGVFLQRKEWKDFFDYTVFIDSSREERFQRENKETQANIEKFQQRYWKAEEYYMEVEEPKNQADLILNN
jgi:uridine kinase